MGIGECRAWHAVECRAPRVHLSCTSVHTQTVVGPVQGWFYRLADIFISLAVQFVHRRRDSPGWLLPSYVLVEALV